MLEGVLKNFIDEFVINDEKLNTAFVISDGKIVKGKPIRAADEIIVGVKLYASVVHKLSMIPERELIDAMIRHNLAFRDKANDMLLTTSVVNYRKLWKATNIETPDNNGGYEELLSAIKNLPHVLSVNINSGMTEMTDKFVNLITDIYEESNNKLKQEIIKKSDDIRYDTIMNIRQETGTALFEIDQQLKPLSQQKSDSLYSLPDEIRAIVKEVLLDVQQQNGKENNQ